MPRTNASNDLPSACARVRPLLDAFHDDAMNATQRARVTRHLAQCQACTEEVAALAALRTALRAPVNAELADGAASLMWERVSTELDRQETVRIRSADLAGRHARRLWRAYARPALAVGAAAAMFVAAIIAQPNAPQETNVARDTFTVDEIEATDGGVIVYESEDTDMTIIWVYPDDEENAPAPASVGDQVTL